MAKIVPKLNLNNHYRDAENNSIVGATNMMISNDYFTLQTEVGTKINTKITDTISNDCPNGYEIKYAIPCNREIVFFVFNTDIENKLSLYRYNEDKNEIYKVIDNFEYNNGKLIGTFTYNYDNLVIAISEVGEKQVPLKVINLGKFSDSNPVEEIDMNQLTNPDYHTICPKVIIPNVETAIKSGNAYKGWYYIFIRYKTGTNNYTQWFNTNESVYIDNFSKRDLIKYYISSDYELEEGDKEEGEVAFNGMAWATVSDTKDICSLSFNCKFNDLDTKYKYYQIGFICVSKTYTKAFVSNDITIDVNEFMYSNKAVNEGSAYELIKTYYNYYSPVTLDNYNNRLYIGNYKEQNKEAELIKEVKNITLTLKFLTKSFTLESNIATEENNNQVEYTYYKIYKDTKRTEFWFNLEPKKILEGDEVGTEYIEFTDLIFSENTTGENPYRLDASRGDEQITVEIHYNNPSYDTGNGVQEYIYVEAKDFVLYNRDGNWEPAKINANKTHIELIDIRKGEDYYSYIVKHKSKFCVNNLYMSDKYSETDDKDISYDTNVTNINQLSNVGILPNNYYNFYIHFVDRYGISTKGIQIGNFNLVIDNDKLDYEIIQNKLNCKLIKPISDWFSQLQFNKVYCNVGLDSLPEDYVGYYITYEKLEKSVLYTATAIKNYNTYQLFNDRFNYDDTVNFNFDKVVIHGGEFKNIPVESEQLGNVNYNISYSNEGNEQVDHWKTQTTIEIQDNKIFNIADTFNNLFKSTNIELHGIYYGNDELGIIDNKPYLATLENTLNIKELYIKEIKELIPCTAVIYNTNADNLLNTKNGFVTNQHSLFFNDDIFYNAAVKVYQKVSSSKAIKVPLINYTWYYWDEVLHESLQFNNKPVITSFPIRGLHDNTSEGKKSFEFGYIVESKNTIDLYKQNQVSVYDLHPKVLDYYNPKLKYLTDFNNTIRRSNVMQDESTVIAWRLFETDNYTNINENKGSITKITGIGTLMLVHTEHSLFQFSSDNSLKTDKDEKIQLANVDIWDIRYKEILTSKLGYGGLKEEHHAIVGEFGYMFYDADSNTLFRFDNGSLKRIDEKITYFMNLNYGRDVTFVDDKFNKRILVQFNGHNSFNHVLSYHYTLNDFISQHSYDFSQGYSTKNNIYLVNKDTNKVVSFYNEFKDVDYFSNRCLFTGLNNASPFGNISILVNLSYEDIKYLEYIKYKLYKVSSPNPSDYNRINYSGQKLIIKSEFCHTKELDLKELIIDNSNYNKPFKNANWNNAEKEPYFRLGNWHFNYIFNDSEYHYDINNISRVYGNWFVITFKFTETTLIELDSIDYKLNKDITE